MSTNYGFEAEPGAASRSAMSLRAFNRFPEDLRTWVKGPALLRLAHSVAQEHTVTTLRVVFSFSAKRFHHPYRLLALLTYAYGSGIWHSRAVAELARLDPNLVMLCHGEAPSMELIRRFRNHNRQAIVRSLEQLIRRIWAHRLAQRLTAVPQLLTVEILCDARLRLQRAEQYEHERETDMVSQDFQGGR